MTEFKSNKARTLYYIKTVVLHSKRRKLKISVNQYAMCDIIDKFNIKNGSMTSFELREMVDMYGIINPIESFKSLKKKGITSMTKKNGESYVSITEKWNLDIPSNYLENFETLWIDYGRVGYKKKSLEMFIRFLKSGETWENLWDKYWPAYKKYINGSGVAQLHLSSFLNPDEEKYKATWTTNAHFVKKTGGYQAPAFKVENKTNDPKDSR